MEKSLDIESVIKKLELNLNAKQENVMKKQQSGFTLIELIMVIVILGALAVAVIPRYVNLQLQADQAALDGVVGSLAAGAAINYADCVVGGATCLTGAAWDNCDDTGASLQAGLPAGYVITAGALAAPSTTCTLTGPAPNSLVGTYPVPVI